MPEDVASVTAAARDSMEKSLKSLRHDLLRVRTGRANPQLLEGLHVDYYGTPTPLNQLANLTVPDPRLIVISSRENGRNLTVIRPMIKLEPISFCSRGSRLAGFSWTSDRGFEAGAPSWPRGQWKNFEKRNRAPAANESTKTPIIVT